MSEGAAGRVELRELLEEYERAIDYTDVLARELPAEQLQWRPHAQSSAIGWHLGHQAAVAHFMIRNLTAAESSPDPELDGLMDSATSEAARGELPDAARLWSYRDAVAQRVRYRIGEIHAGNVGAPAQLRSIASTMMVAIVNHEYQHSKWIGEVRAEWFDLAVPDPPASPALTELDGYRILR